MGILFFITLALILTLIMVSSSFFINNLIKESRQDVISENQKIFDNNVNKVLEEIKDYDGAMIVTYDQQTGEVLAKSKEGETVEIDRISFTEDEVQNLNRNLPKNAIVISSSSIPTNLNYIKLNNG